MAPIGAGLHEPPASCFPFVSGRPTSRQKLMKLLVEVREGLWPGAEISCPSWAKPGATTLGSRTSAHRSENSLVSAGDGYTASSYSPNEVWGFNCSRANSGLVVPMLATDNVKTAYRRKEVMSIQSKENLTS